MLGVVSTQTGEPVQVMPAREVEPVAVGGNLGGVAI